MIDRTNGGGGASKGQANTSFDSLVTREKTAKPGRPTNGDDTLTGTRRSDFLSGRGGNDSISGKGGNDYLNGGSGDDTLSGGKGNDLLVGGSGNDRIRTGEGRDVVFAGRGDDRVTVKGSAYVDGGSGNDTVTLKGAEADYTRGKSFFGTQTFTSNAGDKVVLRNVENVRFSEPVAPPPPPPPAGEGQALAPNAAGAERLFVGPDSVRIIGPDTDFTFTGLTDGRPSDGPLTATAGSGIINGQQTTAVPLGLSNPFDPSASEVVFSLGSGFNPTGTVDVDAAFANGVRLDTQIERASGPIQPGPPTQPPVEGQALSANTAGADTIFIGAESIRLTGPDTDITFTGVTDGGQFGPITAREAKGTVNGELVKAVPVDGAAIVIGPGGFTGIRSVTATFSNGVALDSTIPLSGTGNPDPTPPQDKGVALEANDLGVERLIVGLNSVRLLGPGTDFTFTGITDGRPSDGPLTATAGSGTINGVETTAVSLGNSDPFDPGASDVVFSLGSGFNVTRTQGVAAAFATGDRLETAVQRS